MTDLIKCEVNGHAREANWHPGAQVDAERVFEVRAGTTIVITDHGEPVARIIPASISLHERVEALGKSGAIAWSERRLRPGKPAGKARGTKTVADLVVENRE